MGNIMIKHGNGYPTFPDKPIYFLLQSSMIWIKIATMCWRCHRQLRFRPKLKLKYLWNMFDPKTTTRTIVRSRELFLANSPSLWQNTWQSKLVGSIPIPWDPKVIPYCWLKPNPGWRCPNFVQTSLWVFGRGTQTTPNHPQELAPFSPFSWAQWQCSRFS